jgi:hypothetical protein
MKENFHRKLLGSTREDSLSPWQQVWLDESLRRRSHMLILGSTGFGKSKFLEWLIRGDILKRQGLCLLDIHGELYRNVKHWLSYNYFLTRDVILLDPSKGEYIKGFNPFRPRPGVQIDVQVDGMVQALLRVWGAKNTRETPTLDRVLRLVFTAMVVKRIPLHEISQLINFEELQVREDVIGSFSEGVVRDAWGDLQTLKSRGDWRSEVLSTQNRLFDLAQSKTLQRFMGVMDETSNLDLLEVMNQGKILLVNLQKSTELTRGNGEAFAALMLNEFFETSMMFRHRDKLGHDPRPFYIYLDEWKNIVTPDIETILAEARKFGLLLTLANQDLSQISETFSDNFVNTLLSLCQIKACFGGLNREDAIRLVKEMLVNQIDLNETKYEIASTKVRHRYERDTVVTCSRSSSKSVGRTTADGSSIATGNGNSKGSSMHFDWSPEGLVASPKAISNTENTFSVDGRSTMESLSESWGAAEGESVSDVPILMPEEYTEVTGRTPYTLDEQIWRWSDRFMRQPQRQCYIQLPGGVTVPMLVRFVKEHFVYKQTVTDYKRDIAKLNAAKPPEYVDELLATQPSLFLSSSPQKLSPEPKDEDLYE